MAAKSSHPALTVSPRERASIAQHNAPTSATTTQIPYRRRRLPITPPTLPSKFPKPSPRQISIVAQRNAVLNDRERPLDFDGFRTSERPGRVPPRARDLSAGPPPPGPAAT